MSLLPTFGKPVSVRVFYISELRIRNCGLCRLTLRDCLGIWLAPDKISFYCICSTQCLVHGWLKVLFTECLSACLPQVLSADHPQGPIPSPVLGVVSCCLCTSSHSVAASWCFEKEEGSQEWRGMKLCPHLPPPKLLPSLLFHCPWWK